MKFTLKDLFIGLTLFAVGPAMIVMGRNILRHDPSNSIGGTLLFLGISVTYIELLIALGRLVLKK
jgi:hypothetical protein